MGYQYDLAAKYSQTHAWVRLDGALAVVGVTDYAQKQLSDVMWVELPKVGAMVAAGDSMAVIESVKATDDAYSPVSGEVVEVNPVLEGKPELVNKDPFGQAWLAKVRLTQPAELDQLMDAAAYEAFVQEEVEKGGH